MIKKIIPIVAFALTATTMQAQNYLTFDLGGGMHNIAFSADNGDKKIGFGFGSQIGFRHFFNENWGAGIGLGFNSFSSKITLNYNQDEQSGFDPNILPNGGLRNYHTAFKDVEEKTTVYALDIPLGVYYNRPLNEKWSVGGGLNLIVTTVASGKFKNTSGYTDVEAEFPDYGQLVSDVPAHGLTSFSGFTGSTDLKKITFGVGGEVKAYYAIGERIDLSMGLSGAYRFADLKNQNYEKLYDEDARTYVGVTQTDFCKGVNLINVSATVGIRFRLARKIRPVPAPELVDVLIESPYISDDLEIIEPPVEEKKLERHADDYGINLIPEDYAFVNNALDMSAQLRRKKVGDPIGAPILFATNSDRLKSSENTIMDTVVVFMKENPDVLKLEVSAHTDNVGSDAYNLNLSKRRANTVVNYLVSHGVERKRLSPVGYGESRPLNKNATPEQRNINRRVEFMILELE